MSIQFLIIDTLFPSMLTGQGAHVPGYPVWVSCGALLPYHLFLVEGTITTPPYTPVASTLTFLPPGLPPSTQSVLLSSAFFLKQKHAQTIPLRKVNIRFSFNKQIKFKFLSRLLSFFYLESNSPNITGM